MRGTRKVGLLAAVLVVLPLLVASPAAAAEPLAGEPRDAFVVDVVARGDSSLSTSTWHRRWDSAAGSGPVFATAAVAGGLRITPPAGAGSAGALELVPPDSAPLAVGTYSYVASSWSSALARPKPALVLLGSAPDCRHFRGSSPNSVLVVHEVSHDAAGQVSSLAASYRMPCDTVGDSASGEIRYRSSRDYASGWAPVSTLGVVLAGSRTPFTATVRNTGPTDLVLGAPQPVDGGPDVPRLEVGAVGETCSRAPVPAGQTCTLGLDFVHPGPHGRGSVAEMRLAAPQLAAGHVTVLATVSGVVYPPAPPLDVRASAGFDGVALFWTVGRGVDEVRVHRVDGPEPVQVAAFPAHVTSWVDTSVAKGQTATYVLSAHNAAGEASAAPVEGTRPDLPDPPAAGGRSVVVFDELDEIAVADTADGQTVRTQGQASGSRTRITTTRGQVEVPRIDGPGAVALGDVHAGCSTSSATADVREAWTRADGTVHRLDADLHLVCDESRRIEVQLRVGVDTPFEAVVATPRSLSWTDTVTGAPVTQSVSLVNRGTAPVEVGSATTRGADAAVLRPAGTTCPPTLEPGASCDVDVVFDPVRAGRHEGQLAVPLSTAIGGREVVLSGSALGPPQASEPRVLPVIGRALVRWDVHSDSGSPVTAQTVLRATGDGPWEPVAVLDGAARTWTDTGLQPGTRYAYRLSLENGYGKSTTPEDRATRLTAPYDELLGAVVDAASGAGHLMSLPVGPGDGPLPVEMGHDADLPAVSPDGRSVVFVGYDADGDAGLHLRPLTDGAPARVLVDLPEADETDPAWSPDGTRVCYSRLTAASDEVWCVGTAVGAVAARFPGATGVAEPSFLQDGSGLVVTDVASADSRLLRLTSGGARTAIPGTTHGYWPAVSPRGDRIAFVSTDADDHTRLSTVPLAGGTPTHLATTNLETFDRPVWSPGADAVAVPVDAVNDISPYGAGGTVLVWRAGSPTSASTVDHHTVAGGHRVTAVAWRRHDAAAPTIAFPGAPSRTSATARIPLQVVDDTVPLGGLTVRCSLDGAATTPCAGSVTGTLAAGAHTLTVTAADLHGRTSTAAHGFVVDTTAPALSVPLIPGWTFGATAAVSYSATDASGVASYDVRYRKSTSGQAGFSAYVVPAGWAGTTARSRALALNPGDEVCFSVRARDAVGNVSAWSPDRCAGVPLDDRHLTRATSGWALQSVTSAFRSTLTRTASTGQRLVRPGVYGRRLSVVATTCPTCGVVEVYLGSTRVGAVSLRSSTSRTRQVLPLPLLPSVRTGTLTLRTTSGAPALIDGLAVRKT